MKVFENFDENEPQNTIDISKSINPDKSATGKTYVKITAKDIERMEEIWDILDPIYWTIDIYNSYEEYLKSSKNFTLEQRYLNAISWYFMEVNNGGHFQFFDNSTGIVWEDALNGLKEFGMEELADNFKTVVDLFGEVYLLSEKNDGMLWIRWVKILKNFWIRLIM